MKLEHQMVLQSIEKALELVENKTPEKANYTNNMAGSPLRLREKINSVLHSSSPLQSSPLTSKPLHSYSPLSRSPAVEKSHITFDILNELENNQNNQTPKRKAVHFKEEPADNSEAMSMASREYLKKYGLI